MTVDLGEFLILDDLEDLEIRDALCTFFALPRSGVVSIDEFWEKLPADVRLMAMDPTRGNSGYRVLLKIYANFELEVISDLASFFANRFTTKTVAGNQDQPRPGLVYIFDSDGSVKNGLDVSTSNEYQFVEATWT